MQTSPALVDTAGALALVDLLDQARDYAGAAKAPNTARAYRADWAHFSTWAADHDRQALPADGETVALYVVALAATGYKTSTIRRRISAIARRTRPPAARRRRARRGQSGLVWDQARPRHRAAGKAPALVDDVRAMVQHLGPEVSGTRDRALLLLGFAGAFRRSELVGLDLADLESTPQGLIVTIRKSKTDQEGQGRQVGIPRGQHPATCPVRAVQAWIGAAGLTDGPLFRPVDRHGTIADRRLSDKAVALVVKRAAAAAGLDPSVLAGHSLRAGLATSAAAAGASERAIADQTGHRSTAVLRRYIRHGSLFKENAAGQVGL